MNDKTINCLIAEHKNEIIGACISGKSITEEYQNDGEIISLYVNEVFIGQKIGHLLFEKSQHVLKEQRYKECLICVFSENNTAVRFYKSHGFEIVKKDEKIKIGNQELTYLIMRRPLQ